MLSSFRGWFKSALAIFRQFGKGSVGPPNISGSLSARHARTNAQLYFYPEILQRRVPQIILAAKMLDAADQPRLDPLRRRPLHALGRRASVLLGRAPRGVPASRDSR